MFDSLHAEKKTRPGCNRVVPGQEYIERLEKVFRTLDERLGCLRQTKALLVVDLTTKDCYLRSIMNVRV